MIAIAFMLCVLLAAAGLIGFVYYRENHLPPVRESDVIIVLGAQVKPDGTPSVALERRLTLALETYKAQPQMIIVCGAKGTNEPATEASVMRAWLIERGAAPEHVLEEPNSFNTRENLRNAKVLMQQNSLDTALIITSDYHVARALALCGDVGIDATGKGSPSKIEYFIRNHLREGASWIKYVVERAIQ